MKIGRLSDSVTRPYFLSGEISNGRCEKFGSYIKCFQHTFTHFCLFRGTESKCHNKGKAFSKAGRASKLRPCISIPDSERVLAGAEQFIIISDFTPAGPSCTQLGGSGGHETPIHLVREPCFSLPPFIFLSRPLCVATGKAWLRVCPSALKANACSFHAGQHVRGN